MMTILYSNPSTFVDQTTTTFSPLQGSDSAVNNLGQTFMPTEMGFSSKVIMTFTNNFVLALRQQMDKINYYMVNMLTQQMGTIFNSLIHNTGQTS